MDFAERDRFEKRIARLLDERSADWLRRVIRKRGRWDGTFWRVMEQEYADALGVPLSGAFVSMAEQEMRGGTIGVEWAQITQDSWAWATRRAAAEAVLIVGRTRRVVEADPEPDSPEDAWGGLFAGTRSELIAVTNTSAAATAGGEGYAAAVARENPGLTLEAIWQTARDERVCPRCGPLHGKPRGVMAWMFGPPLHMRCRCYLLWVPA